MPEQAPPASEETSQPAAAKRPGSLPFGGPDRERDQERLIVLLGSLLAAALVLIATTIYIASLRQDATQRANEEQIVRANLTVLERTIAGNLADYANWDDAVEHLALNSTFRWARRNIGPTIHDTLGYAVALLLDPEDRPIYGQVDGEEDAEGAAATLGEAGILLANRARADTAPESRSVAAVIGGAGGYLVAAASTIRPEDGSSLAMPPGKPFVLLFAKRLDARFLDTFANDFGLAHIALARTDQPDTDLAGVDLIGPGGNVDRPTGLDPVATGSKPADVASAGTSGHVAHRHHLREPGPARNPPGAGAPGQRVAPARFRGSLGQLVVGDR